MGRIRLLSPSRRPLVKPRWIAARIPWRWRRMVRASLMKGPGAGSRWKRPSGCRRLWGQPAPRAAARRAQPAERAPGRPNRRTTRKRAANAAPQAAHQPPNGEETPIARRAAQPRTSCARGPRPTRLHGSNVAIRTFWRALPKDRCPPTGGPAQRAARTRPRGRVGPPRPTAHTPWPPHRR